MFSRGQLIFGILFAIVFAVIIFMSYRKDAALNKKILQRKSLDSFDVYQLYFGYCRY